MDRGRKKIRWEMIYKVAKEDIHTEVGRISDLL